MIITTNSNCVLLLGIGGLLVNLSTKQSPWHRNLAVASIKFNEDIFKLH